MNSLYSDDPKLTGHLKTNDFFGVRSNPKSKFVSTKVEKDGDGYKVSGKLTLVGKTKEVTFPAKITASAGKLTLTSSFKIDRTAWGMTYGKGKIDDEASIGVTVASISAGSATSLRSSCAPKVPISTSSARTVLRDTPCGVSWSTPTVGRRAA